MQARTDDVDGLLAAALVVGDALDDMEACCCPYRHRQLVAAGHRKHAAPCTFSYLLAALPFHCNTVCTLRAQSLTVAAAMHAHAGRCHVP